jgi:hypothetical protein
MSKFAIPLVPLLVAAILAEDVDGRHKGRP